MVDGRGRTTYLSQADVTALDETHIRHPWNPKSDLYVKQLSHVAGLSRVTLSLARVPPGKESFLYHRREHDEEFIFILSGRGRAEIGDEMIEVHPGDFMGFPAPDGPAHHLTNPYEDDLVYLMGGERSGFDISYCPREGRFLLFSSTGPWSADAQTCDKITWDQWLAD